MSFSFRNIFFADEDVADHFSPGAPGDGNTGDDGISRSHLNPEKSSAGETGLTYQAYLVSELLPFIPASIAAPSGIPMENEVVIPLPEDGSRDVRLSTLYQVCPELFAIEITPMNDPVVTLPPKLGGILSAPATSKHQPLKTLERIAEPHSARPDDVFEWLKEPTDEGNFLSSQISPQQAAPCEKTGAPGAPATPRQMTGEGFGFDSEAHPFNDKPHSLVPPGTQEKTGKPLANNPFEGEEYFKSLFTQKTEANRDNPFPDDSLTESGGEDSDEVWGAMFKLSGPLQKPFGKKKEEAPLTGLDLDGIGNLLQAGIQETPAAPSSIFVPLTEAAFHPETEKKKPDAALSPLFSSVTRRREASSDTAAMDAAPLPILSQGLKAPENLWPPLAPLSPGGENPAERREPAAFVPAINPLNSLTPNPDSDLRDLELKAIFSTSEPFTLTTLARHIVELPGVIGCSLTTPEKRIQASRSQENRIGHETLDMVATLRSLAQLTGLPEAKTFTLQTDRGIVSLLLEDKCCVTVHHDSPAFQPGVREKLILVARNLINLED